MTHPTDARAALASLRDPWLITEAGLERVLAASRNAVMADAPAARAANLDVRNGVAVIGVQGPLFAHASFLTSFLSAMGGATTYDGLRNDLQAALADPSVQSIVLNIDSPGGEANGCGELAQAIYDARDVKPITAYVSGSASSAAYWIASAASQIVASPTAELGSIGVRMALLDDRKAQEAAGVNVVNIVSSQSPNKVLDPSDDEHRQLYQARVDALADVFVGAVARNRDVTKDAVLERYGRGDVLVGAHAVRSGLADRLGSLDSVLQTTGDTPMKSILAALSLSATASEADALASVMKLAEERRQLLAAAGKESVAEACAAMTAWKTRAAETDALKVRIEQQEAAARAAEFDAELEVATKAGVIPPAAEHPKRAYALSLKAKDGALAALRAYVQALGPAVPSLTAPDTTPAGGEPSAKVDPLVLTAAEKTVAAKMGISLDDYAKTKARRLQMVRSGQDHAHDDTKDEDAA